MSRGRSGDHVVDAALRFALALTSALAACTSTLGDTGTDVPAPDATATTDGSGLDAARDDAPSRDDIQSMDSVTPMLDVVRAPDAVDARADATPPDAGAAPSIGCGRGGAAVGDVMLHAMDGAGRSRFYEVLVPGSYDPAVPLALTFAYHGAGGDERSARAYGLQDQPGAAAASIFVFPRGIPYQTYGVGWDDSCSGYDMPFFDAMLRDLEAAYCVDRNRVYVAGFSWGGDHTTALVCCRGDRIRAAAPASCSDEFRVASDASSYNNAPCPAPTRAAIRFTHATTADPAYPAPLFATTSALYRSFNGCGATSSPTSPAPCVAWAGCARPTVDCAYDGLGHATPPTWAADTWAFFSSFR